ncbi:MAG TPA: alpha/beta hydrolase [Rhizomicrobium sp.]|nr:alpha/beta hydrolase [Rhizomicrobium sp.]
MTASNRVLGHVLHGNGPEPVLVLHDWLGDCTNYDSVLPYLDRAAFTYAFADLRGYGRSRDFAGEYSVDEIARDCLALADALGWRRFHVVGHSMTGMATQRLAADAPERIKSAVAVCPVSAAGNRIDAAARAFFASTATDDAALLRLASFVSPGLSPGFAALRLRQNRERVAPECRLGYLAMLTETDFVADVRGLATPFLVLIGDRDPGLDAVAMEKTFLAWHPNAELKTLAGCGHYPMQECPPAFVAAVEEFLRSERG